MSRQIKVSLLYNDEIKHTTLGVQADVSVVQVISAALAATKTRKGAIKARSADFVVFDMDTGAEIHVKSVSLRGINHVGFYPRQQGLMPDATPTSMARAFRSAGEVADKN